MTPTIHAPQQPGPGPSAGTRALSWLRRQWRMQLELSERMVLMNQPWKAEQLHWSEKNGVPELHGHRLPHGGPATTRTGWCACLPPTLGVVVEEEDPAA